MENLTTLLFTAIGTIGLWLILRPVVLWYFKVNRIEELLEEQIKILRLINIEKLAELEVEKKVDESYLEGVVFNFPDYLKYSEIDLVKAQAQKLQKGQLLAIHNITHKVDFWYIKEYKESIESLNNNTHSIVAIKK